MRIAVAELAQETDSFSPVLAGLADFETYGLFYGEDVAQRMQGAGPIGGFFDVVAERSDDVELVPLLRGWASAGGPIGDETFSQLRDELLDRLRAAGPLDAVFLSLHGAASSVSEDDVEGAVLEEVRRVVGNDVPIAVPLDHHASVTRRMVQNADLLVGHETQPHDPPATGRKTARLMFQMLAGDINPVMAWQRIPLITPQDQFLTSGGPMKEWFDLARELEKRSGVLDVSPYPMQPWLDVAEGGWAVVVHTDGDAELAREVAVEISARAWELREEFWKSGRVSVTEAVRSAVAADDGLVILSDTGDSVYGGAPGDNTTLLRELLRQQVPCLSLIPVVDAAAVAAAFDAGVPSTITLNIGGRLDSVFSSPVEVTGRVASLSENVTTDIPGRGVCNLGRTALIECGAVRIVLLDHRSFGVNHPLLYAHLGIDVAAAKLVVVKTASNFQFFSQWRKEMIRVDTPGTTQSNLSEFEWKRLPRPIFPFDEMPSWSPDPEVVV
ncbi:MAG: M81 family metallopeptidase [Planctomycetaceae bacterium]|jgi:microcystin degradation protein MlrC|nr:M81 family metallopeptidase [Planctomycetaceae bacterium]MBT6484880.1 M81 family metallopeptidase [Planctomycetaceae bacterium]MBT6497648.1 M81 family metallopeptidase [Planctomycetaceae bacterium]